MIQVLNNAIFIPPSHEFVNELMSDLERFIHYEDIFVPHLIKIAIIHYHFETIHPFLDGNGRIGRLLEPLCLVNKKILDKPFICLSDFFEKNKSQYYDKLSLARHKNNLEDWIIFFLDGVEKTTINAVDLLKNIIDLRESLIREKIPTLGKKKENAQKILDLLFEKPVISISYVASKIEITPKTVNNILKDFLDLSIVREITGDKRNRVHIFTDYLKF